MEYKQLEFTSTDPKPLFRDLIAAWAKEEAPEGDGYYAWIDIYLEIFDSPPHFMIVILSRLNDTQVVFFDLNEVIGVIDYPKKWLEILESLAPEYGVEIGNFFYFLKHNRELVYELSHFSRGKFASDGYGAPRWPVYRFLKNSLPDIFYGVHPKYEGVVMPFNTPEEALVYSMAGGLGNALLEIAAHVKEVG